MHVHVPHILVVFTVALGGILAGMLFGYLHTLAKFKISRESIVGVAAAAVGLVTGVLGIVNFAQKTLKWDIFHKDVFPKEAESLVLFVTGMIFGFGGLSLLRNIAPSLNIKPPSKEK